MEGLIIKGNGEETGADDGRRGAAILAGREAGQV